MPIGATETIIWTSVGAFVAIVVGGLLHFFGIWSPRDEENGKWVLRSVLFPLVGGVLGFAVFQFETEPEIETEVENLGVPIVGPTARAPSSTIIPSPANDVDESGDDLGLIQESSDDSDEIVMGAAQHVADWAQEMLAPRPLLSNPADRFYPTCVDDTRALPNAARETETARACKTSVEGFNDIMLLPYRDRRIAYIADLRQSSRAEADPERWEYMQAEYFSFTDPVGEDFSSYQVLNERYRCDSGFLTNIVRYRLLKELDSCIEE